jgi:hypothetical protein
MLSSAICLHLKEAMSVYALYNLTKLLTWYNMKKDSYILIHPKGNISINVGNSFYILSNRCCTLSGYRSQHKCSSHSALQQNKLISENVGSLIYLLQLLIPTVSVVKISKEKTARIIPNAVGVATEDDKHVFCSLLSRDSTYTLMVQVWKTATIPGPQNILSSSKVC